MSPPFATKRSWRLFSFVYLLVGIALFVTACQSIKEKSSTSLDHSLSINTLLDQDDLAQMAANQHPRILHAYGGEYHNQKLERMLTEIVSKLAHYSQHSPYTYRITILNSSNINAFALPGGYVYVTRGLLALANSNDEIAAVLAHEMAHIIANHGLLRLQKAAELALGQKVAKSILSNQKIAIQKQISLAQFSRIQELEADAIGIKIMAEAGYDPFTAAQFLQTMQDYSDISSTNNQALDFLSSHPSTPERIKQAVKQASQYSPASRSNIDKKNFLSAIDSMLYGNDRLSGYIRGYQFYQPEWAATIKVPDGFLISSNQKVMTASGPQKTAIRFDSLPLSEPIAATEYLESGWVSGLDPHTVRAFSLNGLHAARGEARNSLWHFDVIVIITKARVFRLLVAGPKGKPLAPLTQSVLKSFARLNPYEIATLKPLRIHVVRVATNQSVTTLAMDMQGVLYPEKLFRLINGLGPNDMIFPGEYVKIIAP